jgi:hypothetical protein
MDLRAWFYLALGNVRFKVAGSVFHQAANLGVFGAFSEVTPFFKRVG